MTQLELAKAEQARIQSRVTWITLGDCPSKFFFQSLKKKHTQEAIDWVMDSSGNLQTEFWHIAEVFKSELSKIVSTPRQGGEHWEEATDEFLQEIGPRVSWPRRADC